jgi:hypothetical protein
MSALVAAAVWGLCEATWASSAALRSYRWLFRLLLALFFALVVAIYYGSVLRLVPDRFHYGNGVLRYASDATTYQGQAGAVATDLRGGSLAGLRDPQKFGYSKLLGVLFALVGPNPLAAMLLNGLFYAATLACILLVGIELFGARVAPLAVAIAAVWPGFLLHETQTLRWVETTLGLELFVLGSLRMLRQGWNWRPFALALAGYGFLLTDQPYLARLLGVLTVVFGCVLALVARRRRDRIQPAFALVALGLITLIMFRAMWADSITRMIEVAQTERAWGMRPSERGGLGGLLDTAWARVEGNLVTIALARRGFEVADLQRPDGTLSGPIPPLMSPAALAANVPAALVRAVFAPFPSRVMSNRPGVSNIRRFVWIELVPYYTLISLALVAMIAALLRRAGTLSSVQAAFVAMILVVVYALLGTVVTNDGTLYRFRVPYVLLQIVFAAEGGRLVVQAWRDRAKSRLAVAGATPNARSSAPLP